MPHGSRAETFAAVRVEIDNDRWRGIPFLLRTGKAMASDRRLVTVVLRGPGQILLPSNGDGGRPDELVLELTDNPRISVELLVKQPGPALIATRAAMQLDVEQALRAEGIEAYERLLLDVMHGDHLLFTRADEVELLWERAAPLLDAPPDALPYERGSWARRLLTSSPPLTGGGSASAADGRPDPVQPLRTRAESTSG